MGVQGSYGRDAAGVGSDLDLLQWPLEWLALACDVLILTPEELQALLDPAQGMAGRMGQALNRECRWLWEPPARG